MFVSLSPQVYFNEHFRNHAIYSIVVYFFLLLVSVIIIPGSCSAMSALVHVAIDDPEI